MHIYGLILAFASRNSPFTRERMKANVFVSQTYDIHVRWQTEVKVVGLHIASCVPASVKSGDLA